MYTKNQKGSIVLMIVGIIAFIVWAGGIGYLTTKKLTQKEEQKIQLQTGQQQIQQQEQKPISEITEQKTEQSEVKDETADWKTYRNEKYGFEMTLVDAWQGYRVVESKRDDSSIDFEFQVHPPGYNWDSHFDIVKISIYPKLTWQKIQKEYPEGYRPKYITENSEYVFGWLVGQEAPNWNVDFQIMKVLSTFKLIDETANWKTYRNEKYKYSFRYPINFTIYTGTDQTKQEVIPPTTMSDKVFLTDKKEMLFCCEAIKTSVSVFNDFIDIKDWRKYVEIPDYRVKSHGEIVFAGKKSFEVRSSIGIDSPGARIILIPGNQLSFILIQGDEGEPWESITNSFNFE